jgi:lipoprotein-anchoring transpeptidase ErfK/SrfK
VYANPGDSRAVSALYATTEFGNPRILPVTQQGGAWLRVQLPTRPNGSQGWIHARDATLGTVADRVDVDLASRTLTWRRAGVVQLQAVVGIGAPDSPTPAGSFFVTDVLPGEGPEYGAWIVALDAHSDVFTEFEGGDARIAIHGTDDPSSIGRSASSGCVRTDPRTLAALAGSLPPGTPVVVA